MNGQIAELVETYATMEAIGPKTLEVCGSQYRAQGHLSREQLYRLAYDVTPRNAHLVMKNTELKCETVTRNVARVEDDLSRMSLLSELHGFETLTASCVLVGFEPQRYAIADGRVWEALRRNGYLSERRTQIDTQEYCELLEHVRKVADETGHTAAEVGFALYALGSEYR